jgi:hypothetical protein
MKLELNEDEIKLILDSVREYRDVNYELAGRVIGDGDAKAHDSAVEKIRICSDVLRRLEADDD